MKLNILHKILGGYTEKFEDAQIYVVEEFFKGNFVRYGYDYPGYEDMFIFVKTNKYKCFNLVKLILGNPFKGVN